MVQAYVTFRESQIARLRDLVATLQATITKLRGQKASLQARSSQNSGNSSRPPSIDPPGAWPSLVGRNGRFPVGLLARRVGRDTSGSDELSDLRAVLDRVSHGSGQDPGVWLAVVAVSRR